MHTNVILLSAMLLIPSVSPSTEFLFEAAGSGDIDRVRTLLEQGVDVNAAQGDGMSALHNAARSGNAAVAELLIDRGANLEAKTRLGDHRPLHVASASGRSAVVAILVAAGADVNALTTTGAAPLHFAAASGNADTVAALLAAGAELDVREPVWGQTPLMFAAAAGRTEAIEVLLENGASPALKATVVDVIARDKADRAERRRRNQQIAAQRDPKAAEKQKEREEAEKRGNEPEPLNYAGQVESQGGLTPLLLAAREGHTDSVLALLKGGADVNQVSEGTGLSPMLIATINGQFDLAMLLFDRGADPKIASHAGDTPLHAALNMHWAPKARHPQPVAYMQQKTTYLEMMETLLKAGVDPNARLQNTLWYTTYNRDLLGVDRTGATPFWRAAYALDIEAMRLLLRYGADPSLPTIKVPERVDEEAGGAGDGTDHSGLPEIPFGGPAVYPIHAASGVGYGQGFAGNSHRHVPDGWLPAVKFLVEELGADVNARDHNGYTPLHHAAARGDNELILYLISKGADPTAIARSGQTTADMANGPVQRIQPFPETVTLLEKLGSKNNHRCMSC
ncbi:MAG TPA: ankyrin repeat domain-containing protein [Vicinamibacteria bacterium]|nr:ankyrin repeat domain-containing protein [Vicinamibacteria bacterium]